MPKNDAFTRDIRQRVRKAFGSPVRYGSGVAKLFLASGKDFFSSSMPAPAAMLETNKEILSDAVKFLRSPTEVINRQVDRVLDTDGFKALQKFSKNALEDLKSGNFYDPDRDRTDIGMQMDIDLGDFGGFDMDGFGEDGEWGEVSGEDRDIRTQIKIAVAQEDSASKRTGATLGAIGASTEAIVNAENANAQMTMRMSMKQHSQQMMASQNIVASQAALFELVNRSVQATMEVKREAHNQLMGELGEMKTLLTDIKSGVAPQRTENPYKEQDSVFGNNGEIDIRKYIKQVMKNADEKFGVSSMVSTMTMGQSMSQMLELVADNPWKLLSDVIISNAVSPKIKKQMETTNRHMESFFPALLQKFADRGKRVDDGKSTDWKDALFGLLGVQSRSRSMIDTKISDISKQAVITNKFTRTVEEVIPMWLARIDSHISGEPLMIYNHSTGKLERAAEVVARTEHSARDLVDRMGDGASEVFDRAQIYTFKNRETKKNFEDFIYRYLQKNAEEGRFINPFVSEEEFYRTLPESNQFFGNLLQGILKNMDTSKLSSMSREMYDARVARDQNTHRLNSELHESGLIGAWSGFLDEDVVNKLRNETRKKHSGLSSEDIDKHQKDISDRLIRQGKPGFAATNTLLGDILATLQRGIVTYTYALGNLGENAQIPEAAKKALKTVDSRLAVDTRVADYQARPEQYRQAALNRDETEAAAKMRDPTRNPMDYVVFDEMTAETIDEIQKDFIARKVIDPNNARVENWKRAFGMNADAINAKRDRLAEATGAGKMKSLLNAIVDKPFELFDQGLKIMDAFMLKALFGDDMISHIDVDEKPDLFKMITETLNVHMMNAKNQFVQVVADPMKDYLMAPKTGLLSRIGDKIGELLKPVGDKVKEKVGGVVKRFTGEREETPELDENGNPVIDPKTGKPKMKKTWKFSGGKFSGALNQVTNAGDVSGNYIMNAINHVLYGDFANTSRKGVGTDSWTVGPDGSIKPGSGEKRYGGVIGKLKKGFDSVNEMLFGPDSDDPDDSRGTGRYAKRKFAIVKNELHKALPDMIIGGGAGILASMVLPGGPLLGAVLGSSAGFIKSSNKFKTWLFGEEDEEPIYDAAGNPVIDPKTGQQKMKKTRKGRLISKEVYEGISKFAPAVTKGSIIGAVAGGLGLLPFGMGSVAGTVLGAIGGMTGASDQVKKLIFGDGVDDDSGVLSKNYRKNLMDKFKKYAPATMAGAIGGGVLGGFLDAGLGLIPGLSIIPGGPIMTAMGSMVGLANADTFNKFFFGEEVTETVNKTDKDGNVIGTESKKTRKGGLFGRFYDYTRDHIFEPVAKKFDEWGKNIGSWFKDSIITPLSNSLQPLRDSMDNAGKAMFKAFSNIGNNITTALFRVFNVDLGEGGFRDFVKTRFMPKLKETTDKFFGAIGNVIGNILSAPFKALEFLVAGTVGGKTMDEIRDERSEKRHEKQKQRTHRRAEKHAQRNMKRAKASKDSLLGRWYRKKYPQWYDSNEDYVGPGQDPTADDVRDANGAIPMGPGAQLALPPHIEAVEDEATKATSQEQNAKPAPGANAMDPKAMADDIANKKKQQEQAEQDAEAAKKDKSKAEKRDDNLAKAQERREKTEKANREKNTSKGKKKKDTESYLKDISKYLRNIRDEIKGQVNGVGWNTAYIKTLLEMKFGPVPDDQLPEEMEGSKKHIKKRRGLLGKAKDAIFGFAGTAKDRIVGLKDAAVEKVMSAIDFVATPFRKLGEIAGKAKDALGKFTGMLGSFLKDLWAGFKDIAKIASEAIHGALETAKNFLTNAAAGFGQAIGNMASFVTGTVRDLAGMVTSTVRTTVETVVSYLPDVAHMLWKGAGKVVKGGVKLGGKLLKGGAGMVKRGFTGAKDFISDHLPGGKKRKEERKSRYKNIGTFEISNGKLDDVTITNGKLEDVRVTQGVMEDVTITHIGGIAKPIPFPYVSVINGIAKPMSTYAIPVYILGVDQAARFRTVAVQNTNAAEQRAADQDFKQAYERADKLAENSSNPADAYDKAVAGAKTAEEMQAIALSHQMNDNNQLALPAGSGEKKEESNWLMDMLGLGGGEGGGLLDTVSNFFGSGRGKKGFIRTGLSMLGKKLGGTKLGGFLGGASNLIGTAMTGMAPLAIGTMVGQATGTEDRGVTGGVKMATKGITNILKDSTWGAKIANGAHNLGTKMLGKTASGAVGIAGDVAGSKGLISKIVTGVSDMLGKVFNNPIVKKLIPEGVQSAVAGGLSKFTNTFKTKFGKVLEGVTKQSLEGFAKKAGVIVTVATAAYDLVSGYNEAANILKIESSQLNIGMRFAAGVAKCVSGLAFGLIPVSWLAETAYTFVGNIFTGGKAGEDLDSAQAAFKEKAVAAGMSVDDYNKQTNKTTWQSIKDTAGGIWNGITGFFTGGNKSEESGKGPVTVQAPRVQATKQTATDANNATLDIGRGIGEKVMDVMKKVIRGGAKNLPSLFATIGTGIGGIMSSEADNATGQKGSFVTSIAAGVSNAVSGLMAGVDQQTTLGGKIKTVASNAWSGIKNFFGWGKGGKVRPMSQKNAKYNRDSNNMALTGCGPTAAAMVASAYGKKLDPKQLSDISYGMGMRADDGGTNPAFFNQVGNMFGAGPGFGMKQGPTDPDSIQSNLKNGQPVVLMGKGGPFGGNMHYLVADGMGKGGEVNLVDPLTGSRKTAPDKSIFGNTASTIYSYGKGPEVPEVDLMAEVNSRTATDTNGNTHEENDSGATKAAAQQALVDQMTWLHNNPIRYSLAGGQQDPDKGVASCASTVGWAYRKVLNLSGMSAGSSTQSRDSRFTTIWTKKTANESVPLDLLEPGDIVYDNWDRGNLPYDPNIQYPMQHTEMYVGDGKVLSHGGPGPGPIYASIAKNDYGRKTKIMAVRRYTPFLDGSSISYNGVDPTTVGASAAGVAGAVSSALDFSSANADGGSPLDLLSNVLGAFSTKMDNVLNAFLTGGAVENSETGTTGTAAGGTGFNFGASAGTTNHTETKQTIWNWLRNDFGLTPIGASGIMGCWENESNNVPNTLEGAWKGTWKKRWNSTDEILSNNANLNEYTTKYLFPMYGWTDNSGYKMADGNYYPGIGLAQWTKGRAYNLLNFAKENNLDWRDVTTQLKFFKHETDTISKFKNLKGNLNAATTPEDAAKAALDGFEMYSGWSNTEKGQSQLRKRAVSAAQIYNTYKDSGNTTTTQTETDPMAEVHANTASTYGTGPGCKGKKCDTFTPPILSEYGTGAEANVEIMNDKIRQINSLMTKTRQKAEEESTVAQVTTALTDAVKEASSGETGGSDAVLKLLTSSLATMIELLSSIKDNTEKKDAQDERGEYPGHVAKTRAEHMSDTGVGVNDNDIGQKIIDELTYK